MNLYRVRGTKHEMNVTTSQSSHLPHEISALQPTIVNIMEYMLNVFYDPLPTIQIFDDWSKAICSHTAFYEFWHYCKAIDAKDSIAIEQGVLKNLMAQCGV